MRLSNKNRISYYNFLLTLINLLLIGGIGAFILEKTRLKLFGNESILLVLFPVLLLLIYKLRGKEIFEYDSDGEAINFRNRYVIPFLGKEIRDEFPKYKVVSYEVVNAIVFKRLFIKIIGRKDYTVLLKYDISYLSTKEINDLKFSLKKIVAENKEAIREGKMQS